MQKRGDEEQQTLNIINNVIGRTDWDYACVKQINPRINYFKCNETLRPLFYKNEWSFDKCEKFTIAFSQAHYPIKGLHTLLQTIPYVRSYYPDVHVKVIGDSFLNKPSYRLSSYEQYMLDIIRRNELDSVIEWVGFLNEKQMIAHYVNAHVYVNSSNIENSSNSIGEAMLLGMPVIASDVGGIKSLLNHEVEGLLYQDTAPYMLGHSIIRIFEDKELAISLGKMARNRALKTHDPEENFRNMYSIYLRIAGA